MTTATHMKGPSDPKVLVRERFAGQPEWLMSKRESLAEIYASLPLPVRERTPLKNRKITRIPVFEVAPTSTYSEDLGLDSTTVAVTFVNGQAQRIQIPSTLRDQGVIVSGLKEALDTAPQLVEQYLGSISDDSQDKFQALNGAFWQNGLFLYVPVRTEIMIPITVTHVATKDTRGLYPRSLIIADRSSRVVVTERYLSEPSSERNLLSATTEVVALDGSFVQYGAIQQLGSTTEAFLRRFGRVGRDAQLDWNIGEFGAALAVSEHQTILDQPGGQTHSITVFFGAQSQHQDYTAKSLHVAPHTTSNMVAKGVMKDNARSVFTGITDIQEGAVQSDGRQKEQTLMLSDNARADAIPSLLIQERDVYAAHAASAGPVDKSALFYLTGRGIPEDEAVRLIVHGFLAPVIDSIPLDDLKETVWEAVERKIRE